MHAKHYTHVYTFLSVDYNDSLLLDRITLHRQILKKNL